MSPPPPGKILLISDVHGLIPEMNEFLRWLTTENKQEISLVVHLGDFWKGRNFDGVEKKRDAWENLDYFDQLVLPIFMLKGNEDLDVPDSWWDVPNLWPMPDQEIFQLNKYKAFPIDYQFRGEHGDEVPKNETVNIDSHVDFILSHRPPFGLLDHTLHLQTHRKLSNTGSPMVRYYVDKLKSPVVFFGHFHYSNFLEFNGQLVICIDKLVRKGAAGVFRYSYALIDPFDDSVEVYWKNRLFLKYSIPQRRLLFAHRHDRRNLERFS